MERYQGRNLNDALKKVMDKYNCLEHDITYEVIEERKGILGIGNSVTIEAYTNTDIKNFIFDYLGAYFTELGIGIKVEIIVKDGTFKVILNADNNALIIGRGGKNLTALNTVLKAATSSVFKKRILTSIDVNHYKDERYRKLKLMAKRLAHEVGKSKVDVSLDPMPSDERKIIHQFLADYKHIKTESEGEGNRRHLVIKYKD